MTRGRCTDMFFPINYQLYLPFKFIKRFQFYISPKYIPLECVRQGLCQLIMHMFAGGNSD